MLLPIICEIDQSIRVKSEIFRKPFAVICYRKKVRAKIRGKVENFTFNPYILYNFTYNMEQPLDSDKEY